MSLPIRLLCLTALLSLLLGASCTSINQYIAAENAFDSNNCAAVIKNLEGWTEKVPFMTDEEDTFGAFYMLAQCYFKSGDYTRASICTNRALEAYPGAREELNGLMDPHQYPNVIRAAQEREPILEAKRSDLEELRAQLSGR